MSDNDDSTETAGVILHLFAARSTPCLVQRSGRMGERRPSLAQRMAAEDRESNFLYRGGYIGQHGSQGLS